MHRVCLLTNYSIPLLPNSLCYPTIDISQSINLTFFTPRTDPNNAMTRTTEVTTSFPALVVFALVAPPGEDNNEFVVKAKDLFEAPKDRKRFRLFLAPSQPLCKWDLNYIKELARENGQQQFHLAQKGPTFAPPPPLPFGNKSQMFYSAQIFEYIRQECETVSPAQTISYHEIVCPSCILKDMQEKQEAREAIERVEEMNLTKAEKKKAKQRMRRLRQKEQRKARKAALLHGT